MQYLGEIIMFVIITILSTLYSIKVSEIQWEQRRGIWWILFHHFIQGVGADHTRFYKACWQKEPLGLLKCVHKLYFFDYKRCWYFFLFTQFVGDKSLCLLPHLTFNSARTNVENSSSVLFAKAFWIDLQVQYKKMTSKRVVSPNTLTQLFAEKGLIQFIMQHWLQKT